MSPPGEIRVINPQSRAVFKAHPTGLYSRERNVFQYRVDIPGIDISFVVIEVTSAELTNFLLNGKPIPVKPVQ